MSSAPVVERSLRRKLRNRAGLAAFAVLAVSLGSFAPSAALAGSDAHGGAAQPWLDARQPIEQRVHELLSAMTLDEKIGQMTQVENLDMMASWDPNIGSFPARNPSDIAAGLIGSVLSGGDGNPSGVDNTAQNWYSMVNTYQQAALATRLGIPIMYGADMVHGASHITGTTIFPQNVGLGATRDPALIGQICRITAKETSAAGVRWTFGPTVAVPQDVRWGRTYEGYGENTKLVSQMASSCVQGLQSGGLSDQDSVVATPKHFIGDGGTAYGSSTAGGPWMPYLLDQGTDELDNATIAQLFLLPYQKSIQSGARVIMTSFSSTRDGGKVTGDKHWITDVLKKQLGFSGFVVSDWGAIDQINPADYSASVEQAINAGVDMAMVPDNWQLFESTVKALVASGAVSQSRIDDAVTRILRVKFEMGLFEHPMPPSGLWNVEGSSADRAVAARAVAESAVLLKTSKDVLPIGKSSSVLLAGQADDLGISSGGWTLQWQGTVGNNTTGTTLKAALAARLGSKLSYSADGTFAAGTHASVGVVVVSEYPYAEGYGDSSDLQLPTTYSFDGTNWQMSTSADLINKMRPLVDKLIVVVMSGRPVMLDSFSTQADAIVEAWLPGTENEGLADVLLGTRPFTGTLPYTWPKTPADAPRIGKTACQGALYPYGYGLNAQGKLLGPKAC